MNAADLPHGFAEPGEADDGFAVRAIPNLKNLGGSVLVVAVFYGRLS